MEADYCYVEFVLVGEEDCVCLKNDRHSLYMLKCSLTVFSCSEENAIQTLSHKTFLHLLSWTNIKFLVRDCPIEST